MDIVHRTRYKNHSFFASLWNTVLLFSRLCFDDQTQSLCFSGSALFRSVNSCRYKSSCVLFSEMYFCLPTLASFHRHVLKMFLPVFRSFSSVLIVEFVWAEQITVVTPDNVKCSNMTTPVNWFPHHVMSSFPLKNWFLKFLKNQFFALTKSNVFLIFLIISVTHRFL